MIARSVATGTTYVVRPVVWCAVCEIHAPADHTCDLTRHPGTDALIADLRTAVVADAPATTAQTPTTTD